MKKNKYLIAQSDEPLKRYVISTLNNLCFIKTIEFSLNVFI